MKIAVGMSALLLATSLSATPPMIDPAAPVLTDRSAVTMPDRLELARSYVNLADPGKAITATLRAYSRQFASNAVTDVNLQGQVDTALDGFFIFFEPRTQPYISRIVEAYAQVYAREFTTEELREMIAFARSPVGQHYLQRAIAIETDPAIIKATSQLTLSIAPAMQDYRRQMCGKRAAERVAAGDTKARCPLTSTPEVGRS